MKTLSDFNFKNKTVLLRADLNSDVHNGRVLMSERIKESVKTINELKKKKARVVIISHQGRPGKSDFLSLRQHAGLLNKLTKIKFIQDVAGKAAENAISSLKPGEAVLLENIRMEKDEFLPEKERKNKLMHLAKLCDIYVNDAFSVCHRKQASVILLPKYMKSCAGRLLEKELTALKKAKMKSCLFILAGAKPEENLLLLNGKNKILACGLFGQLCLVANGKNLGAQSEYLRKEIGNYYSIIKDLKKKLKKNKVLTPSDFAVEINGKRKELTLEEFPNRYEIFDIGSKTIKSYVKEVKKAKTIYMKGPAGYCAKKQFCKGTVEILNAISKNRGFSLIGGGHLSDAIKISKIPKRKFGHISLSGGALLRHIAGEKLPGIEALR